MHVAGVVLYQIINLKVTFLKNQGSTYTRIIRYAAVIEFVLWRLHCRRISTIQKAVIVFLHK